VKDLYRLASGERVPRLTVDAWIRDRKERVLLVRRGHPPYEGRWALPGGFCDWGETTEQCCAREAKEETGLTVKVGGLLGVFSKPGRDPRGQTVTVLYACRPVRGTAKGGDDAAEARWFTPAEARKLPFAFDHGTIAKALLGRGSKRVRRSPRRRGKRGA
jgi:8-oxo-dGTP diphosphatase